MIQELSPLHEHERVVAARVVAVADEGTADGARRRKVVAAVQVLAARPRDAYHK